MKHSSKKLISLALAVMMAGSVVTTGLISASAKPGADNTYIPDESVSTKTCYFAMPGVWQADYWKQNSGSAGAYWWTGSDTPDSELEHGWPGYRMNKVTAEGFENLYSIQVPDDVNQIIFNNYLDGGMPGTEDYSEERFDAASQTMNTYVYSLETERAPYSNNKLMRYVWGKAAESAGMEPIQWSGNDRFSNSDYEQMYAVYDELSDSDSDLVIPEFGAYANNFYMDQENLEGVLGSVDKMVYVCNLDPNSIHMNYTIVPEGQPTYDGAFYFYYGNGEYGAWPTKSLLANEGIYFTEDGIQLAKDLQFDAYGNIVRFEDGVSYVVYGRFDKEYNDRQELPDPVVPPEPVIDTPKWTQKDDGKIYFYADPALWKNYKNVDVYIYEHNGDSLITWGSKKGMLTDEGDNVWSYDPAEKGITLESGKQYGLIFSADWGLQTCDLIFDSTCFGDLAYMDGKNVENNIDSNKKSYTVHWVNMDKKVYAPPVCITSIGDVIGEAFWKDETPESLMERFLTSEGIDGIQTAVLFNGKTMRETAYDAGEALGLTNSEVEEIAKRCGVDLDGGAYPPATHDEPLYELADEICWNFLSGKIENASDLAPYFEDSPFTREDVLEEIYYETMLGFEDYNKLSDIIRGTALYKGDVNGDGVIDVRDATLIQQFAAGKNVF